MNKVHNVVFDVVKKKWILSVSILCIVVCTILFSLWPPLVLGQLIDRLTLKKDLSFSLLILYFSTLVLSNICLSLRDSLLIVLGQKITHALRSCMMKKQTQLDMNTLSKQDPGNIVSRFISDVDQVELLFTSGIIALFSDALQMMSIFIVIYTKTKGLFLLLLCVLPIIYLFTRHVQKRMLQAESENRKAISLANAFIPQTIHNLLTIHNLHVEDYMTEQYDTFIDKGYRALNQTNFYDAIYSPVILILNAIVIAIVMLLSSSGNTSILYFFGMSAGSAVAIMNYVTQIFTPIESMGMEIQTIQSALAGVVRINEFLSLPEKKKYDVNQMDYRNEELAVQISNMSFGYDEKKIFDHYNLSIQKGEHLTLQGRTGAGKSTLFKLILGLYEPEDGEILVCGIHPYTLDFHQRRKIFGYVEQKFHPVLGNIKDQITLFDESISDEQVMKALKRTGLDVVISSIYDPCKEEMFSQGQWQILSIARAIVCDPPILMLDEITSDLDTVYEKEILDTLVTVSKNRTVISISHRNSAQFGKVIKI